MSGLNCATPSPVAWPELVAGIDLFAAIDDDLAREGMRDLAGAGLVGGECSGGGLGAARAVLAAPGVRAALRLPEAPAALVFLTEGATDPAAYEAIVGLPPALIAAGASPGRGSARGAGPPA